MFGESAKIKRLRAQLAEEKAEHEATRRKLRVAEVEIEAMAGVIARDRQRIQSESAAYARQQAESELHGRITESPQ